MEAMIEDLQPYPPERIESAFAQWRRISAEVPRPANILKFLYEEDYVSPLKMAPYEKPETYERKELSPVEKQNLDTYMKKARAMLRDGKIPLAHNQNYPWIEKVWKQYTPEDVAALKVHLEGLARSKSPLRAQEYLKYLNQFCNVPLDIFKLFEQLENENN